jgi:hypothetical protein
MLRSWLRGSTWGVGVSLLLTGCDPKIMAFDVQPRHVCAGDSVHISWKVRGTPHVLSDRLTVDSVDMIRYTLVAESRGKKATRTLDVITFTPGVPRVLAANTGMLGTDSLVGRDSARAAVWHSLVEVGDVGSDSGRALRVTHVGREGVVGPGREASSVWRGLPVSGVWEIRSGLKPREVPGNGARRPPQQLFLRVGLACAAKGSQPIAASPSPGRLSAR